MPQYLAPGVYVEEIAGPRTIQGVSTSTAAFVGPCRFGPTSGRPELLTSFLDFVRIYGDTNDLFLDGTETTNYLALGVKGFFDEGGTSAYVSRVFSYSLGTPSSPITEDHASKVIPAASPLPELTLRARFPGLAGQMQVTLTLNAGNSCLVGRGTAQATLTRVHEFDSVYAVGPHVQGVYAVRRDPVTTAWTLAGNHGIALSLPSATAVYPITVVVDVRFPGVNPQGLPVFGPPQTVGEFSFDPRAAGGGISVVLAPNPPTRAQALTIPIALEGVPKPHPSLPADDIPTLIAEALLGTAVMATPSSQPSSPPAGQVMVTLDGGSDGLAPTSNDYQADPGTPFNDYQENAIDLPQRGLVAFESIDDISIVAAPGASTGWGPDSDYQKAHEINGVVIDHCEKMLYRVAALDTPPGQLATDALTFRNNRSSNYASLYYPWITIASPADGTPLNVPPSGYMAGIWARSDNNFGVIKAPANEVVTSAIDFETRINKAQQELLNPEGVNCLRFFPGPGFLVWGARTISDDPEWKYLSIRRYFNYLEKSIDEGTQWVVFEVNGPALWAAVRHSVEGFLLNEWKSGALLGSKPEQAFYVTCDATTMTQDDLDNGRLICLIGVAAAKPAEFVIFRISQWTASAST
jgi:phage tail sheath protein FI